MLAQLIAAVAAKQVSAKVSSWSGITPRSRNQDKKTISENSWGRASESTLATCWRLRNEMEVLNVELIISFLFSSVLGSCGN